MTPGQPVAFDNTQPLCGDSIPAVAVTDTKKPWGVCVNRLAQNAIGDCIVAGPAVVSLATGGTGDYAEPDASGTGFARGEKGSARVLYSGTNGKGIILLGGTSSGESCYNGFFTLVDASDDDGPKVKVTDPRVDHSELVDMLCKVNSTNFGLSEWTSDVLDERYTYIYLHFNGEGGWDGGGDVVIEASNERLEDEGADVYYLLGRVKISEDGAMTILQDHCSGSPQLLWISSWCPGDDE